MKHLFTIFFLLAGWILPTGAQTVTRLTAQVEHFYNSSAPSRFVNLTATKVLFTAKPVGRNGDAPYATDGTTGGTVALLPSLPADDTVDGPFHLIGSHAYFFTTSIYGGAFSLWKTDGTPAGTTLVSSAAPWGLRSVAVVNNRIIGIGSPPSGSGTLLWSSDGTPANTGIIHTPASDVSFNHGTAVGNVYYLGTTVITVNGRVDAVWKSNGTSAGTVPVATLSYNDGGNTLHDQFPDNFTALGGFVYFLAQEYAYDSVSGQSYERSVLWKTDGTTPGTQRIGAPGLLYQGMYAFSGSLFLERQGSVDLGGSVSSPMIAKSDGTLAGTSIVFAGTATRPYTAMSRLAPRDGFLYYNLVHSNPLLPASPKYSDLQRLKPDGTFEIVASLPSRWHISGTMLSNATVAADQPSGLYLKIDGGVQDIWRLTSGTPPAIARLGAGAVASDALIGGHMIGSGNNFTTGAELYSNQNGLTLIADLSTGVQDSNPAYSGFVQGARASLGNLLLYSGQDPVHGQELWRSDGTVAGTYRLIDATPGALSSSISHIFPANGFAWVILSRGDSSSAFGTEELWKTDGTVSGTTYIRTRPEIETWQSYTFDQSRLLVKKVPNSSADHSLEIIDGPGTGNVLAGNTAIDPTLASNGSFWWAENISSQNFLKRSDGSANPATEVTLPSGHQLQFLLIPFGDGIIATTSSRSSPEFFFDDLTHVVWFRPSGNVVLRTFSDGGTFPKFLPFGGKFYFTYNSHITGVTLYASDGTAANTIALDTAHEIGGGSSDKLIPHAGYLYYTRKATAYTDPIRIHRTGGTPATTGPTSIEPVPDAYPEIVSAGGWLLYTHYVYNYETGQTTDQTRFTSGSVDGQSIPGMISADLSFYQNQSHLKSRSDNVAFFNRYDPTDGDELWKIDLPSAPPSTPFAIWAQNNGLTGNDALPGEDADKDGVKNLVEFYNGTLPGNGASTVRPAFTTITPVTTTFRIISVPRMPDTGLTMTVESSIDLVNWNTDITVAPNGTTTQNPSFRRTAVYTKSGSNPEIITFTILPTNTDPKIFVRFRVTEP